MSKEWNINGYDLISSFISLLLVISWLSLDQKDSLIIKNLISLSLLLTFVIHFYFKSNYLLFHIFLLGICFRFHYLSYTGFEQLPFADAQLDFFMANVLMENGELTIITHELHDNRLAYYSSWPLSQTSVVVLSFISDTSLLLSTNIIQLTYYTGSIMLFYGIVYWFQNNFLDNSENLIFAAMLLFISLPELNYWQGEVVRMNLGILSHFFVILCIIRLYSRDLRYENTILLILASLMISFSHNLTSALSVLIFSFFAIIFINSSYFGNGRKFTQSSREFINSMFNSLGIITISTIIWWSLIGDVLFPKIQAAVSKYWEILSGNFTLTHDPRLQVAAELSPLWSDFFLFSRDFILFFGTAVGFILLFIHKRKEIFDDKNILYFSLVSSYVFIFISLFFWAEPFRVLAYTSPLMAVSFAYFFNKLQNKNILKLDISSTFLILILMASFISPLSHTHSPVYFYDDDLSPSEFGEPSKYSNEGINFLLSHTKSESTFSVDYPDYAAHMLNSSSITRLSPLSLSVIQYNSTSLYFEDNTDVVLLIRGGSLYQHSSAQATQSSFVEFTEKAQDLILSELNSKGNLVYDQGNGASIWTTDFY